MTNQTKITFNLAGLDNLKRQVGDTYRTRVGILGSSDERTDGEMDNAIIGIIQIFGSITKNIPKRDFLISPIQSHAREIISALKSSAVNRALKEGNIKRIYELLGVAALQWVHQAFSTSGFGLWPQNKASTIRRKGSDKPLIDTRQLERAQTFDVVKKSDISSVREVRP